MSVGSGPRFLRAVAAQTALAALRLGAAFPYPARLILGALVGSTLWHVLRRRREIARANLAFCLPELDAPAREVIARAHFRYLGIAALEMGAAWFASDRALAPLMRVVGQEHLQSALDAGKGALVVSAHFLATEMGLRLMSSVQPGSGIYRPHNNPIMDRAIQRGRARYNGTMIRRDDFRGILRALRRNQPVWYPPDQDHGPRNSIFAPLFGRDAATLTATTRLARMSGAPVVPLYTFWCEQDRGYEVVVLPPLDDFPGSDEHADAARLNAILETQIRAHLPQYLWVHRRFKTRPDGETGIYSV